VKFGIGILGATGYIAAAYRREIRECAADEARIVALCARRRDLLEAAAREDGAALATDDWRSVVEHPDVDTVLVATPDALHYEPVLAAARLKKHIICEKPLGTDARQAREMWDACRAAGVGHYVPFWSRYVPVFQRLREVVRAGTVGDVRAVVCRWHTPRPLSMPFTWRDDATLSSAGSVADIGSHTYDTLRWLLGDDAVRVLAHATVLTPAKPDRGAIHLDEAFQWAEQNPSAGPSTVRRGTAFDYANMAFELPDGAVGTILLSHAPFLRKDLAPEIELHGTRASLAVARTAGTITIAESGKSPQLLATVPDPGFGNRFAKHVFPALRERAAGKPCDHPGLDDGYEVQRFTTAAAQSAQRGAWVALNDVDAQILQ
jgi:predicted dehydrogenase